MATFKYINESHIYFQTKSILQRMGWTPIAGEPSGGSDNLPRIEIRDPDNLSKGSKGSYKIDIISTKNKKLLLTEVKVLFDIKDVYKLNEISLDKLLFLQQALMERLYLDVREYQLIKSLALSKFREDQIPKDFVCFDFRKKEQIYNELLLEN